MTVDPLGERPLRNAGYRGIIVCEIAAPGLRRPKLLERVREVEEVTLSLCRLIDCVDFAALSFA